MAEIRMPKMGDGMEEGTILRWIKREGDSIRVDEPIAEIETDKANVEMPAEEAGTLTKIVVKEGETVPVGAVIAVVGEGAGKPAAPPAAEAGNGAQKGAALGGKPVADPGVTGEAGTAPRHAYEPAPPPPIEPKSSAAGPAAERLKASPLARKMAQEQGIDLARVKGSGPGGRIVERDIQALIERGGGPGRMPEVAPSVSTSAPAGPLAAAAAPNLAGQDVETSKMRKAISRRTVQSKQTVPHIYVTAPVEMDTALNLLARMNDGVAREQKITINDLIVKACAAALQAFPDVNVSWTPDDKIRRYEAINIAVAVGTDEGLTMPVILDCGKKTLRQISAEAKALVNKARAGALTPQEMSGATFSTSNLGMFGVEEFSAIINPPESAILAIGAVTKEAVVAEDGAFVARQRMRVTLSCDHRTVDGLLGARFVQEVKRLLESPYSLLA